MSEAVASLSDRELVERALGDDRVAANHLFHRHQGHVRRWCLRLMHYDRHDADDLLQDAFADAFSMLRKLREASAFRGWVKGIASKRALKAFSKRTREREGWLAWLRGCEDPEKPSFHGYKQLDPELLAEAEELVRVLDSLTKGYRKCWFMRRIEGFTIDEITDALHCSASTAKRGVTAGDLALSEQLAHSEFAYEPRG